MTSIKAKWKRAPLEQRRVTQQRSAPQARFTRSQRSGALPPSLPTAQPRRSARPLLIGLLVTVLLVGFGSALVIAVGSYLNAEQQFSELEQRAGAYGLPTQPFATLDPQAALSASAYPPNAALDDPRWQSGTAAPLNGSFALRHIPAYTSAPPLRTVTETVEAAFITDAAWQNWAQLRIDDTIGWVDTASVNLQVTS